MVDPIVLASAVGLVASPVAGRALLHGLDATPQEWRRSVEWLCVAGVVAIAGAGVLASDGPIKDGVFVLMLGALPGIMAFIAWRTALASAIVSLVPLYFGVGSMTLGRPLHTPAIALDRLAPLQPAWMFVYASMYVFVLLPLLVVRDARLFRCAMRGYVFVLAIGYAGFIAYPTVGPRPAIVPGDGFGAWSLRLQYAFDWNYNCFPSLHVAHSFVSALTVYRVRRDVGVAAVIWAALIGASTVFTKQHYVLDAIAGALMGTLAYWLFLRRYPREAIADAHRRAAPRRALYVVAIFLAIVVVFWAGYATGVIVPS